MRFSTVAGMADSQEWSPGAPGVLTANLSTLPMRRHVFTVPSMVFYGCIFPGPVADHGSLWTSVVRWHAPLWLCLNQTCLYSIFPSRPFEKCIKIAHDHREPDISHRQQELRRALMKQAAPSGRNTLRSCTIWIDAILYGWINAMDRRLLKNSAVC